jgi:energy-coupling factor transport system ATP-binding protein
MSEANDRRENDGTVPCGSVGGCQRAVGQNLMEVIMSIKIDNLSYTYMQGTPYEKEALKGISLEIRKGEFVGLIGHTGSGKSTLVQHFNALLKPTTGKVYINGVDIWDKNKDLRRLRYEVGLVFQYPEHQLFEETVYKDIAFGPNNIGLEKEEIDRRVHDAISVVGIGEDMLYKSPFELSGGQKRRVAIAGVLAMQPSILILDEPTAGLDPSGREEILSKIKIMREQLNMTVVLISHSMEDIARLVERVMVIHDGKIVLNGITSHIFSKAHELEGIGLSVPQIVQIINGLRAKGISIPNNILTMSQAKEEILKIIKTGRGD